MSFENKSIKDKISIIVNYYQIKSFDKLIEEANLKGVQIGGAMVSSKHSNFIVNEKNATAKDVADLMIIIQNKVYENTGILLQPEVEWLGNKKIPNIFQ